MMRVAKPSTCTFPRTRNTHDTQLSSSYRNHALGHMLAICIHTSQHHHRHNISAVHRSINALAISPPNPTIRPSPSQSRSRGRERGHMTRTRTRAVRCQITLSTAGHTHTLTYEHTHTRTRQGYDVWGYNELSSHTHVNARTHPTRFFSSPGEPHMRLSEKLPAAPSLVVVVAPPTFRLLLLLLCSTLFSQSPNGMEPEKTDPSQAFTRERAHFSHTHAHGAHTLGTRTEQITRGSRPLDHYTSV